MHLLLTACTSRKKAAPEVELRGRSLSVGKISDVAAQWSKRLKGRHRTLKAAELYGGRSFQEALSTTKLLGCDLAIVSAGLGLVRSTDAVPAYSLSAAAGSADFIHSRISHEVRANQWWAAISRTSPFANDLVQLVRETPGLILVGLPKSYLAMIDDELLALPAKDRSRLRILTGAPFDAIDPALQPYRMPYDDRLDGPDCPVRGTRSDFASRAALHFGQNVLLRHPDGSADAHAKAVEGALASWRSPPIFERTRHDDESLIKIINDHWDQGQGHSSKLLRILRDDLNIACEQGRFADLMNLIRATRKLAA